jgi:IS5 family transposase
MRRQDQLSLTRSPIDHPHAAELEKISEILSQNPRMARLVEQDLTRGVTNPHTGARGLSGDQVLRILIVKQRTGFSYEELGFHLADSMTYRSFCGFGPLEPTPSRSTLAENIKKVQPKTLQKIQRRLVRYAVKLGIETGDKVRLDATVSETNIHHPTDSSLLFDGVRVLSRLLAETQALCGFREWSDHTKRAKRRLLAIHNTGNAELRLDAYTDLLKVTHTSIGYADAALKQLRALRGRRRERARTLVTEIEDKLTWIWAVIDQTERRVLDGESVPSEEKIVSIFEPHTDIIVKDRRETLYGHKLFLAAGASGLITDCVIADGNPADTTMALPLLVRQKRILGRMPEQVAFDGGFASKANLQGAKALGIREVAFSKKKGLSIADMTSSPKVYHWLTKFRAGIEGLISCLKRAFGLGRCTWKGAESFASYVLASVITGNLFTIARHVLA